MKNWGSQISMLGALRFFIWVFFMCLFVRSPSTLGGFKKAFLHLNPIRAPCLGDPAETVGICPSVTQTFGL